MTAPKRPPQPAGSNRIKANQHARNSQLSKRREVARQFLDRRLAEQCK